MQFSHVEPARIARWWPAIARVLAPAVRQDPTQTLQGVYARLMSGPDVLVMILGEANGLIVFEVTDDLHLWTKYVGGRVAGTPKQRLRTMCDILDGIEVVARDAGCTRHRICGRDWSLVAKGYTLFDDARNGLEKEL